MAKWHTHKEWANRYLEWVNSDCETSAPLLKFPKKLEFLTTNHDYNRRAWRSHENRITAYNKFGEKGLEIMDIHYSLDFLKEETDPQKIEKQAELWNINFSNSKSCEVLDFYPSVKNLARHLAGKTKSLNMNIKVFKFNIVNFRDILSQLTFEHGYEPNKLRDWNYNCFNNLITELKKVC